MRRWALAVLLVGLLSLAMPAAGAQQTVTGAPPGEEIAAAVMRWLPPDPGGPIAVQFLSRSALYGSYQFSVYDPTRPVCGAADVPGRVILVNRDDWQCLALMGQTLAHERGHFVAECIALFRRGEYQAAEDCAERWRRAWGY